VLTRRRFLGLSLAAAAGAGAVGAYATRIELHWVEYVRRTLPVRGLPAALAGRTLVQLSDLHVGRRVDPDYLAGVLRRVRDMAPDLVVYTGDFISWRAPGHWRMLSRVLAEGPAGRLGTFGILGNHDYGPGWRNVGIADQVAQRVEQAGIRMLRNASVDVAGLTLVGLDDLWSPRFRPDPVLTGLDSGAPAIVLCHIPDAVDLPDIWSRHRGWVLSGHTHGGQVRIPPFPPPLLPVRNRRYAAGEIALTGERTLYVNRGVGHLLPVRFCVRPEVTVFTLARA
jgi:uncharacterized protein